MKAKRIGKTANMDLLKFELSPIIGYFPALIEFMFANRQKLITMQGYTHTHSLLCLLIFPLDFITITYYMGSRVRHAGVKTRVYH